MMVVLTFKCQNLYTLHKLADCPDGFPGKTTYVPLTDMDVILAKKCQTKKEKALVTAIVNPTPVAVVMSSAVLSDRSDCEYIGFKMGNPWVNFSHTVPIPANTVTHSGYHPY